MHGLFFFFFFFLPFGKIFKKSVSPLSVLVIAISWMHMSLLGTILNFIFLHINHQDILILCWIKYMSYPEAGSDSSLNFLWLSTSGPKLQPSQNYLYFLSIPVSFTPCGFAHGVQVSLTSPNLIISTHLSFESLNGFIVVAHGHSLPCPCPPL